MYTIRCQILIIDILVIDLSLSHEIGSGSIPEKASESAASAGAPTQGLTGITVDKSVEFSYEELAKATKDFSQDNKIGQGGFGSVYYAELRGEVCSILHSCLAVIFQKLSPIYIQSFKPCYNMSPIKVHEHL